MKILIADDSITMRRIMCNILNNAGMTDVEEVGNGQQAVDAFKEKDYDLLLLDWNMPVMLGIDALRSIRALGRQARVIMVTTEAEKRRVIEALKAGANNYIIKPFKPETIIAKVSEVMGETAQTSAQ